jgi:micrococcal nuclease
MIRGSAVQHVRNGWRWFRGLRARWQVAIVVALLLVPGLFGGGEDEDGPDVRTDGGSAAIAPVDRPSPRPSTTSTTARATTSTSPSTSTSTTTPAAVIARVVDGDTLVLTDGTKVRLIGVDTPETKKPGSPVECFGPEATAYTQQHAGPGTEVRLEYDVERLDRYGRTLVYLYRRQDGLFLNLALVADGFAQVATFPPNVTHVEDLLEAQRSARAAGRGLWGARCAEEPPPAEAPAQPASAGDCHPSYDPCVPVAGDADCASGSGNGPVYVDGPVQVTGPDDYGLDSDGNGVGCER